MKRQLAHSFEDIISLENLAAAWQNFCRGKSNRPDVLAFGYHLADNIFDLHTDLRQKTYRHGAYEQFNVFDPKPRIIHKASVRDRVVHHALYRLLYPFYDQTLIADSYSCRIGKGTHAALKRFETFSRQVSRNYTRTCWVLQWDIQKFFANIDHATLIHILQNRISDEGIMWLVRAVIESFSSRAPGVGLPLGNLTSQLLVNIYMNEFDQWMKHTVRAPYYLRYADDMALIGPDLDELESRLPQIRHFLQDRLHLTLHPDKIGIKTVASGVDWLGWVYFPHHRVLRTTTKRRVLERIRTHPTQATMASYLGLLQHGNTKKLQAIVQEFFWLLKD